MANVITSEQFRNYFKRDFPYLPYPVEGKVYFIGDVVYVAPNFYESLIDNNTAEVSETEAWKVIKGDETEYLSDDDIAKAIGEMLLSLSDIFGEKEQEIVQLYLTAFYLVLDIQNAEAGLSSKAYSNYIASKSVSSVSESYAIPSWVQNDPTLSLYMDNGYGKKYLTFLIPRMKENSFFLVEGGTTC